MMALCQLNVTDHREEVVAVEREDQKSEEYIEENGEVQKSLGGAEEFMTSPLRSDDVIGMESTGSNFKNKEDVQSCGTED